MNNYSIVLVFDEHDVYVSLDVVSQEVEVKVGLHPHVHAAHHAVQGDIRVDGDHFGREPWTCPSSINCVKV